MIYVDNAAAAKLTIMALYSEKSNARRQVLSAVSGEASS